MQDHDEKMWCIPAWNYALPYDRAVYLLEQIRDRLLEECSQVPATGNFKDVIYGLSADDWEWVLFFTIESGAVNKDLRDFAIKVRTKNSDMLIGHYVVQNRTKAEIESWLQEQFVSDATLDEITDLLQTLKEKL